MSTPAQAVLGVYVGSDTLEAVLVRPAGDRFEPVRRYVRSRAAGAELQSADQMAAALPGLSSSDDADYTLQVGGDWGAPAAPARTAAPAVQGDGAAPALGGRPFVAAFKEILAECATDGYADVPVAFCLTAPEVAYVELLAPAADDKKGADKKRVADAVRARAPQADPARTVVVPLAGGERALAVAVDAADPVTTTLQLLTDTDSAPTAARLDAEATLVASLIARAHAASGERTLVIRVGTADTVALVFEGPALAAVERLQMISAYDSPETVSSRVLLQLDARKTGDPDTVYVLGTGRTDALLARFQTVFPDAAVEPFDEALAGLGLDLPRDEGAYRAAGQLAAAAAARELGAWATPPDVHLLPAKLRRRRRAFAPVGPTVLAGLLLAAVLALSVVRFLAERAEVKAIEAELIANPPVLPSDDPDRLQARVDSLNLAYTTYTRALDVLDSLLVGSDQWTQALRLVTRSTEAAGGTWLTAWALDGGLLRISGQSVSRPQIVDLTRRLDASIEMLEYTDVGPRRVYSFDMRMPVEAGMPEVARFLREIAASPSASRDSLAAAMVADSTAYVVDPVGHTH